MIYAYIFIRNALSFLNKSIDYKNRINPSQLNLFCFLFEIAIKRLFHFIKSKIKRLLVPLFAAGFFFMLPIKFLGNFYTFNGMIQAILSYWRGGLEADDGHLWFLAALFWCLIIFGTLIQLLKKYILKMHLYRLLSVLLLLHLHQNTLLLILWKSIIV